MNHRKWAITGAPAQAFVILAVRFELYVQVWSDEVLRWDPNKFGGVTQIRLPATHIWTPDIVLYNKYVLYILLNNYSVLTVLSTYICSI